MTTYRTHPLSEKRKAVELHSDGLGSKSIARKLGIDPSTVRMWLRRYRTLGETGLYRCPGRHLTVDKRRSIETEISMRRATHEQIAFEYGVSRSTVSRIANELRAERRRAAANAELL